MSIRGRFSDKLECKQRMFVNPSLGEIIMTDVSVGICVCDLLCVLKMCAYVCVYEYVCMFSLVVVIVVVES